MAPWSTSDGLLSRINAARIPGGTGCPKAPQTLDLFPTPTRPSWAEFIGGVRQERTGWRDQEISERHRRWGASCPAVDLDFLLTEIHVGEPAALVEYKHFRARPVNTGAPVFTALQRLADRAEIPFLVAWYWPDSWAFRVRPMNDLAREHFEDPEDFTERGYVQRLYRLRRLTLVRSLTESLLDVLPPVERRTMAKMISNTVSRQILLICKGLRRCGFDRRCCNLSDSA